MEIVLTAFSFSTESCKHIECFSSPNWTSFEDSLNIANNAVHIVSPVYSKTERNGILGKLNVITEITDIENEEERSVLSRYMCEIYEDGNEGNKEKAYLYYKLSGEIFTPIIIEMQEKEVESDLGTKIIKVIGEVYNATDEGNIIKIEDSDLIGNLWPVPEYQTISSLMGKSSGAYFELDNEGNASIISDTIFEKISEIINEQTDAKEKLNSILDNFIRLSMDVSETTGSVISDTLSSYKDSIIDAIIQKITQQTTEYIANFKHIASENAQAVIKKLSSKTEEITNLLLENNNFQSSFLENFEEKLNQNKTIIIETFLKEISEKTKIYLSEINNVFSENTRYIINEIEESTSNNLEDNLNKVE
ncbi:MAG: hypothetical protein LBS83_00255, partial [Holosporales bacterium]|nr:hypothetical protein [Holosporales bacterium]